MEYFNSVHRDAPEGNHCVEAKWHVDLPWPWFVFRPAWACPFEQRVGELFDGGKWVCSVDRLRSSDGCVVYSIGSDGKTQFETELQSRTGCTVHIFDPTVDLPPEVAPGIYFHRIGLAATDGPLELKGGRPGTYPGKTLSSMMAELGHTHLHLLKIDVDGIEWDVFRDGVPEAIRRVDELLIELHWNGLEAAVALLQGLMDVGLRIFHHEPNLFYYSLPSSGIEYSFVRPGVDSPTS